MTTKVRRLQKKNWRRYCRAELRQAKRIVGSHLRWIAKARAHVRPIRLRRTFVAGYDVFESRQLPYTDKDGQIVHCVVCKRPADVGFFTPRPYMVMSPMAYTEMVEHVKERTNA